MATLATQRGRLYHDALLAQGIEVIEQSETELTRTHEAIFAVKAGRLLEAQRLLRVQLDGLLAQADAVVMGCTELGLVLAPGTLPVGRVIDAADVLADALAAKAYWNPIPANARSRPGGQSILPKHEAIAFEHAH